MTVFDVASKTTVFYIEISIESLASSQTYRLRPLLDSVAIAVADQSDERIHQ